MAIKINELGKELVVNSDKKTLETVQNFFKEKIKLYGVKTATVSKISKKYFQQLLLLPSNQTL